MTKVLFCTQSEAKAIRNTRRTTPSFFGYVSELEHTFRRLVLNYGTDNLFSSTIIKLSYDSSADNVTMSVIEGSLSVPLLQSKKTQPAILKATGHTDRQCRNAREVEGAVFSLIFQSTRLYYP